MLHHAGALLEGLHQVQQGGLVGLEHVPESIGEHPCRGIRSQSIFPRREHDTEIAESGEPLKQGHTSNTVLSSVGSSPTEGHGRNGRNGRNFPGFCPRERF
jgi:hypothetical protein